VLLLARIPTSASAMTASRWSFGHALYQARSSVLTIVLAEAIRSCQLTNQFGYVSARGRVDRYKHKI
jgi:hypothetical protein